MQAIRPYTALQRSSLQPLSVIFPSSTLRRQTACNAAHGSQRSLFLRVAALGSILSAFRMSSAKAETFGFESPKGTEVWWNPTTTAVVTGANKGIGWAIAANFAALGIKTVVTSRDEGRGKAAVEKIQQQTGSKDVHLAQLELANTESVQSFAKWTKQNLPGGIDILVNNAGVAYKGSAFGPSEAEFTLNTNFWGTKAVCEALEGHIKDGGRIVNVCSVAGKLRIIKGKDLQDRFVNASTPAEVGSLADKFVADVRNGRHSQEGWPNSMYGVSKLCESTYSRILANELQPRHIMVSACCPGYVATDMSSHRGYKTTAQGADTPTWLALVVPPSQTGKWWTERHEETF